MGYNVILKQEMEARIKEIKDNGYVYCYGAKHKDGIMTEAKINNYRRWNSQVYTDQYYKDTLERCLGKYAIDCSGLVCYIWGITETGSWWIVELPNTYSPLFDEVTDLSQARFGDCIWKPGHVGFVLDSTTVFEAAGLYTGVRESSISAQPWKKIIRPKNIPEYDYPNTGWIHEQDGSWWYAYGHSRGNYYQNTIIQIDGKPYAFDAEGWLVSPTKFTIDSSGAITNIRGDKWKS